MALPEPSDESTALVTGASSGIGEQLARGLADRGHGLTLVARGMERLDRLAAELSKKHKVRVDAISADLADGASRDELAAEVERRGREVEVLVNCAGYGIYSSFLDSGREKEVHQLRLLVEAVVDLTARYLPGMVERGRGAVINLSSTAGIQPLPYNAGYSAAKAYVDFLSEALHTELRGTGVTVTSVMPGPVRTGFQEASGAEYFAERMPGMTIKPAERVAADALRAVERGRRATIPGGAFVKMAFGPNRFAPRGLQLAVGKRLAAPPDGEE
ncbi:MAG: SDR family oxidoreductase [Actinobacteria bacterium]|nr:SDR family oxidoreductase [Actinomycetota bacterium]